MEVVGVAGVGRGRKCRIQGRADEGEELTDVVEDIVGGTGEEETVVGGYEGDALGETVGCVGRETHTYVNPANGTNRPTTTITTNRSANPCHDRQQKKGYRAYP